MRTMIKLTVWGAFAAALLAAPVSAQTMRGAAGGAVGAPPGVPGAAGNTSPGFGRSSAGGSGGFSTGPTNPSFGTSTSGGSAGTPTGPTIPMAPR